MFNFLKKSKDNKTSNNQEVLTESYTHDYDYSQSDAKFEQDIATLKYKYNTGKIPKLTDIERRILEFCDSRDMREFLREEFEKHPINLDENGCLIGENPFKRQNNDLGVY